MVISRFSASCCSTDSAPGSGPPPRPPPAAAACPVPAGCWACTPMTVAAQSATAPSMSNVEGRLMNPSYLWQILDDAEPHREAVAGPETMGGADRVLDVGGETATLQDMHGARFRRCGIGKYFAVVRVRHPLPDVAEHVVNAPRVWRLRADLVGHPSSCGVLRRRLGGDGFRGRRGWRRAAAAVTATPAGEPQAKHRLAADVSPGLLPWTPRPARVFPFELGRQTVRRRLLFGVQRLDERLRVLPRNTLDRVLHRIGDSVALEQRGVGAHHRRPLRLRHLGPADQVRLLERDWIPVAAVRLCSSLARRLISLIPHHS